MKKLSSSQIKIESSGMDYVNPKAKVVIVGITPGESQMEASRCGKSKKDIKRENAFAGGMRKQLVRMLDAIGVNRLLNIKTCDTLWSEDFDKVQMTSLLRDATYYRGKMYRGKPSILGTPVLQKALTDGFVKHDCRKCSEAKLYVALGPRVKEVLNWLKAEGKLVAPIVTIPHASGSNGGRIAVFLGNRSPNGLDGSYQRAAEMRRDAENTMAKLLAVKGSSCEWQDKIEYFLSQATDDDKGLIRESEYKGKINLGRCDRCAKGTRRTCEYVYCEGEQS